MVAPSRPRKSNTLAVHEPIRAILTADESKLSSDQKQRLLDYFLTYDAPADLRRVYAELNALKDAARPG